MGLGAGERAHGVVVRVRRPLRGEVQRGVRAASPLWSGAVLTERGTERRHLFGMVCGPEVCNAQLYTAVVHSLLTRALVPHISDHALVLCHGAAGSGRWHTIYGTDRSPGLLPLALGQLAAGAAELGGRAFCSCVSFRGDAPAADLLRGTEGRDGARQVELSSAADASWLSQQLERLRRREREKRSGDEGTHVVATLTVEKPAREGPRATVVSKVSFAVLDACDRMQPRDRRHPQAVAAMLRAAAQDAQALPVISRRSRLVQWLHACEPAALASGAPVVVIATVSPVFGRATEQTLHFAEELQRLVGPARSPRRTTGGKTREGAPPSPPTCPEPSPPPAEQPAAGAAPPAAPAPAPPPAADAPADGDHPTEGTHSADGALAALQKRLAVRERELYEAREQLRRSMQREAEAVQRTEAAERSAGEPERRAAAAEREAEQLREQKRQLQLQAADLQQERAAAAEEAAGERRRADELARAAESQRSGQQELERELQRLRERCAELETAPQQPGPGSVAEGRTAAVALATRLQKEAAQLREHLSAAQEDIRTLATPGEQNAGGAVLARQLGHVQALYQGQVAHSQELESRVLAMLAGADSAGDTVTSDRELFLRTRLAGAEARLRASEVERQGANLRLQEQEKRLRQAREALSEERVRARSVAGEEAAWAGERQQFQGEIAALRAELGNARRALEQLQPCSLSRDDGDEPQVALPEAASQPQGAEALGNAEAECRRLAERLRQVEKRAQEAEERARSEADGWHRLAAAETECRRWKQQTEEAERRAAAALQVAERQPSDLTKELAELRRTNDSLHSETRRLRRQLADAQTTAITRSGAADERDQLGEKLRRVQSKLEAARRDAKTSQEALRDVRKQLARAVGEGQRAAARITELEARLSAAEATAERCARQVHQHLDAAAEAHLHTAAAVAQCQNCAKQAAALRAQGKYIRGVQRALGSALGSGQIPPDSELAVSLSSLARAPAPAPRDPPARPQEPGATPASGATQPQLAALGQTPSPPHRAGGVGPSPSMQGPPTLSSAGAASAAPG
eukprot:TRINITY_DN10284_c0_g1_i2.p1 TRINITY_DN10284_c0_g1~~TRINITY_DN10284_c0_g1_i2.p1  ORF type:complete len:1045 (+),score=294.37 TRINITY_DN10284_c0_g1_i2:89-3223(+)